jgi:hypothetical protein
LQRARKLGWQAAAISLASEFRTAAKRKLKILTAIGNMASPQADHLARVRAQGM